MSPPNLVLRGLGELNSLGKEPVVNRVPGKAFLLGVHRNMSTVLWQLVYTQLPFKTRPVWLEGGQAHKH
jgi:hypothetical protein